MGLEPQPIHPVILADIVGSSRVAGVRAERDLRLASASRRQLERDLLAGPYAITAGDEFQGLARRMRDVPRIVFDLRAGFFPLELWIAVGYGEVASVPLEGEAVNVAGAGEAFELAREAMTRLKSAEGRKYRSLTAFRSRCPRLDLYVTLVYRLVDTLLQSATKRQMETIVSYHRTGKIEETAADLGVHDSTVSRNLRRGRYWQIRDSMEGLERLLAEESAR